MTDVRLGESTDTDGLVTISVEIDSDLYTKASAVLNEHGLTVEELLEAFIRFCALPENKDTLKTWWDTVKHTQKEGSD